MCFYENPVSPGPTPSGLTSLLLHPVCEPAVIYLWFLVFLFLSFGLCVSASGSSFHLSCRLYLPCLSLSISLTPRLPLCLCGALFSLGEETLAGSPLLFSRICPHVWLNQACHSLWKSDRHFPLVCVDSHLGEGLCWTAAFCPGVMMATSHPAPSLTLDILSNSVESWSLPFYTISSVPFWLRAA